MAKQDELKVNWSKRERDLMIHNPYGVHTNADAAYLFGFFNKDFIKEMAERGYDITTVKFEIKPILPNLKKFLTFSEQKTKTNG